MTARIKRIREQQLLSVSFVAEQVNLSTDEYKNVESKSFNSLSDHLQSSLTTLLGVEYKDLEDTSNENNYDGKNIGLARIYNDISDKDKKEINRLLNYKKLDMRSRV